MNRALILFGAFDRHNFGDMLFAHVAQHMHRGARTILAGLAARDLRAYGGHQTVALSALPEDESATLLHVGGEVLTCGAWEAAVMLQTPEAAQACIARYGHRAEDRAEFARATLGTDALAPYVAGRESCAHAESIGFSAAGGVALDTADTTMRAEVLTKLRYADALTVRDAHTQANLREVGIEAALTPDPAAMVKVLFDDRIRAHTKRVARDYIAVQFSADFGDDATLRAIASQLDALNRDIVLFRAGAAPWHDDIGVYERLTRHLERAPATIFRSLNIWDICALIANSAGYAGSSLHGRIVAMAYGLPRVNLLRAGTNKQDAYASTWEPANAPGAVRIDDLSDALYDAMQTNREALANQASELADAFRTTYDSRVYPYTNADAERS